MYDHVHKYGYRHVHEVTAKNGFFIIANLQVLIFVFVL